MSQDAAYFRALQALRRRRRGWPRGVRRVHAPGCLCHPCRQKPLSVGPWLKSTLPNLAFCDNVINVVPDLNALANDLTGEKIRTLRKSMRLNQAQFAAQVGVSWVTLSRWECGHMRPSRRARNRIYEIAVAAAAAIVEEGRTTSPDFSR